MNDLVKRARAMAQGEARSGIGRQRRDLFEELADEIERLRKRAFSAEAAFRALQDAVHDEVSR